MDDQPAKPTYIAQQTNNNCQQFYGPISGCVFAMPGAQVTQQMAPQRASSTTTEKASCSENASASEKKRHSSKPNAPKRELMTFTRKDISDGHLRLLYVLLTKQGWLSGQEPDFITLFSGQESRITLTWLEPYGKGTLRFLFRQMQDEGLIDVPHGFSLDHIIEGHFADTQGHLLTGLNSSGDPNAKALPFIQKCIQLLHTGFEDIDREEICEMMGAREVNDENRGRRW